MPLTPFQREILAVLARRRTAGSHVGGGSAINRDEDSPRYSRDVDIFHDVAEAVSHSAAADEIELVSSGYAVTWKMRQPTPLGVLAWAACGKDEGFNPNSLLDRAKRHVRFNKRDLDRELSRVPLDLQEMKREWNAAVERAETLIASLPAIEIGCFYVDDRGTIRSPDPASPDFATLNRHFGSIGGAWPKIQAS